MGFDEVTDWDYYQVDEDGNRGSRVRPNPFDAGQPRRTRASSGSVVRIFRGELTGKLGASLRSRGMDKRVLVKEFSGKVARDLAASELAAVGTLQSAAPWVPQLALMSVLQSALLSQPPFFLVHMS